MKVLTIFMFTVVLVAVVMADGEVEKKKVWVPRPMYELPRKIFQECIKTMALEGCLDKIQQKLGMAKGAFDLFATKHLIPTESQKITATQ